MHPTRAALAALLLLLSLAAGGCALVIGAGLGAAGAYAGHRYEQGRLLASFHQPYERVYEASLASLKQMNIAVTKVEKDAAGATISAKRPDGTAVSVELSKAGPQETDAVIQVGLLGNEAASKAIADTVAANLSGGGGRPGHEPGQSPAGQTPSAGQPQEPASQGQAIGDQDIGDQ